LRNHHIISIQKVNGVILLSANIKIHS